MRNPFKIISAVLWTKRKMKNGNFWNWMEIILLAVCNKVLAFPFFSKFLLFMHNPYMHHCLSRFWFRRQEIILIHFRTSATFQRCCPTKECLSITRKVIISRCQFCRVLGVRKNFPAIALSSSFVVLIRFPRGYYDQSNHEVDLSDRSVPPKQSHKTARDYIDKK